MLYHSTRSHPDTEVWRAPCEMGGAVNKTPASDTLARPDGLCAPSTSIQSVEGFVTSMKTWFGTSEALGLKLTNINNSNISAAVPSQHSGQTLQIRGIPPVVGWWICFLWFAAHEKFSSITERPVFLLHILLFHGMSDRCLFVSLFSK